MRIINYILFILLLSPLSVFADNEHSTKKERNFIREGNEMFEEKRYGDAEKLYQKALQENESSSIAKFNLATTYLKQINLNDSSQNELLNQTKRLLEDVALTSNTQLASKAYYNLGNICFNKQDFAKSIDFYKQSLRKDPNDDEARENLRLAQKKLNENKDNKNQDKQNQQKEQDKEKQQQDQNKQKDKNGQDQNKPKPQQPQEQQNGMSKENAERILQTMQNEEKNTQNKVNKAKMQQMQKNQKTTKQW